MMTSGKYPKCECSQKRYEFFRKRYRDQTLHLIRRCAECGKTAQNCMPMRDYDRSWVDTLPIETNGVMEQPVQNGRTDINNFVVSNNDVVRPTRQSVKPESRAQSRADAIMKKLQRHIQSRSL